MAKSVLIQSLNSLSKRIDDLISENMELKKEKEELEKEIQDLRRQHELDKSSIQKAQRDLEFLALSHRLADSPEALISARNKISELIRTIDKCILLMNED